jgi:hypothetical protein
MNDGNPAAPLVFCRFHSTNPSRDRARRLRTQARMFQPISAYVVAVSAMLFAALSAISLFTAVRHLEAPKKR